MEEPGRRIVQQEMQTGGTALPWADIAAFLHRVIELSLADREAVKSKPGWVFFDRGLIDAAAALERITGESALTLAQQHRYYPCVFLTPPWPEIYIHDGERKHSIEAAIEEYKHLVQIYPALGYTTVTLSRTDVCERADQILATLGSAASAL